MRCRRRVLVLACAVGVSASANVVARADGVCPAYVRPVVGPITRHFERPPTPFSAGHRGIDLAVATGTPVRASAGGTVHFAGQVGGDLFVSIDHAGGLRSTYSFVSAVLTRAGRTVAQGEAVARSGKGHDGVEPAHLHFGILRDGDYLDPEPELVASMRCDLSAVVRLAPAPEPTAASDSG